MILKIHPSAMINTALRHNNNNIARRGLSGFLKKNHGNGFTPLASLSSSSLVSLSIESNNNHMYQNRRSYSAAPPTSSGASQPSSPASKPIFECNNQLQRDGILCASTNLLRFSTLHELQQNACRAFAANHLFGTYDTSSQSYGWMTYSDFQQKVNVLKHVLVHDFGIQAGDKIGLISNNRWEWYGLASAAYSLNATVVPMYEAQRPNDWLYILNDAGVNGLFVANQDIYESAKTGGVLDSVPSLRGTMVLDGTGEGTLQDAMERAERNLEFALGLSSTSVPPPTPQDLANLVYTSGTTGKPKGVELTHDNHVSNVGAVRSMVSDPHDFIRQRDRSLAFLPWAHSYGFTCELSCFVAHGSSMGISRGVTKILEDLQLVKPTALFSVPTLYKRIYDGVQNVMVTSSPLKRKLMESALRLGRQANEAGGAHNLDTFSRIQHKVLDAAILSKIRGRFGGQLRHGFAGGAAIPSEIMNFMDDLGIPVYEGYGLTETSPLITLNSPDGRRVGFVGKTGKDITVVIIGKNGEVLKNGEEGEICCYGPNVMRGYWKREKETEEVFSIAPDGSSPLFHTGDLGRMGEHGFLSVTGRLKEQYKLENGKYIVPTPIEEAIGMSRFIQQVVLVGANRPHNTVLLVLDWVATKVELGINNDTLSEEELANDPRVKNLIDTELATTCAHMKKFETPRDWAIVAPFTAANDMLTPKMSIRRHMVVKAYSDLIEQLYNSADVTSSAMHNDRGSNKANEVPQPNISVA